MPTNNLDLDLAFLNEIADGSNEFIVESIEMFLLHTPVSLNELSVAVAGSDWKTSAATAHKLKSNLGFFGMTTSQSLMQEIELQSKQEAPVPALVAEKLEQVKALVAPSLSELEKIKAEKKSEL